MRGFRTLRTRLFLWLLGAIVIAAGSSALVVGCSRPDTASGAETMARSVGAHLDAAWDEPERLDAYVAEVHDVTGFDVRLFRDPRGLPRSVHRAVMRGGAIAPDGPERMFVPVVREGRLVGALQMDRFGVRPRLAAWWRLVAGLAAALAVLALAAGQVANMLARPLEQLATAADRFGAGDLAFRSELADPAPGTGPPSGKNGHPSTRRWVAAEIQDVAVAFNKMAQRVEAVVRGQRELLAAISHELRSPLGRARIALEIARDRVEGNLEATPGYRSPAPQLDDVERQLVEVEAILGDLLAVTRAGLADLNKENVPLGAFLRACIAAEPNPPVIELEEPDDGEALLVSADTPLLGRAIHNLIANARTYGHPAGLPLVVRVEREGAQSVRIAVRDRGPGLSPHVLGRVFEPFVRGDRARSHVRGAEPAEGTGLGLALVRRIAEAHGGSAFAVNVGPESGPAEGAVVGVVLPLVAP